MEACAEGLRCLRASQWKEAIQAFDRSLRLDPRLVDAWDLRARAWGMLGQYERALKDETEALRLDPRRADSHAQRAQLLFLLHRFPEALDGCERALALRPTMVSPQAVAGIRLRCHGRG